MEVPRALPVGLHVAECLIYYIYTRILSMKNFEISEKVQKSLREREVVFQSSQFTEIGWQELPVAKPDTIMGE